MNVEIKTYHKEMKPSRTFSIFHSQFSIIFWVLDSRCKSGAKAV